MRCFGSEDADGVLMVMDTLEKACKLVKGHLEAMEADGIIIKVSLVSMATGQVLLNVSMDVHNHG